jgi:TolB protein
MKPKQRGTINVLLALAVLGLLGIISLGLAGPAQASAAEWGGDDARTPTGDWEQLASGESQWYAFQYAGDGSQVQVTLEAVPPGSASFVVWTPELIERWGAGYYVEPIGRGSVDPNIAGRLTWSGDFHSAGTYYVVVEPADSLSGRNQAGSSYYLLDVIGIGVSLSEAASTPAAEPANAQPPSDAPGEPTGAGEPSGRLVFQTTYGGPFYTINVDGSDLQRITNGIDPVWSPDGRQIAFVRWEEPRGVWVVDVYSADGASGDEWRAFDWSETRYPSWSPDGSQIVFSRQSGGGGGGRAPGGASPASASASEIEAVRRRPPGGPPGGGSSGGSWTLGIVNPYDGTFAEPQPDSTVNLAPDWSPNGEQIVYNSKNGLRIMSVDGKSSYALTNLPKDTSPVWSPDGSQVAFVRWQHDHWEVYVVNADGSGLTRLTNTPALPGAAGNSVSPAWSPDGDYIAFLTDRSGEWEIWRSNARGGEQAPMFDTELDGLTLEYAFAGERAISWTE